MKIALVQMRSSSDLETNLAVMRRQVEKAKQLGADLVVFPEVAYFTGRPELSTQIGPEFPRLKRVFSGWAKEIGIHLIPGTVREPLALQTSTKASHANLMMAFGPDGSVNCEYRKIFLFKAKLPDRAYDETDFFLPGSNVITAEIAGVRVGFTICFDLRFPELFRALKKRGAQVILVPAAFTAETGRVHWEVLLRARAIENQCYIVAPGLVGTAGDGSAKHGHSLVVDPWGNVILDMGQSEDTQVVEIAIQEISNAGKKIDVWGSRREDLFPIG